MLGTRTIGTSRSPTPSTIRQKRQPAANSRPLDTPGRAAVSSLLAAAPRAAVTGTPLPIARLADHSSPRVRRGLTIIPRQAARPRPLEGAAGAPHVEALRPMGIESRP